ncbi:MAG: hypothetical protein IME99_06230 [Proteobacteria bacterium]|nr:hypothetical protein [Pseudomonadota bacterium]
MPESKDKAIEAVDSVNRMIDNKLKKKTTRRGFLKSAVLAGLAIGGGVLGAKKMTESVLKEDNRRLYSADAQGVERTWKNKKLTLMSKNEKEEMVSSLLKSFKSNGL